MITEQQAIAIAHDDAVAHYDTNLDANCNTTDPISSVDPANKEWRIRFPLKVPARGGEPFYRIDGTTGAIIGRCLDE